MDMVFGGLQLLVYAVVKVLPEKVAMLVIGGGAWFIGFLFWKWHEHFKAQIAFCNSFEGRFTQLSNGSAQASCGGDSLMSIATLLVALFFWFWMVVAAGVWIYQVTHPKFKLKDTIEDLV